MEKRKQIDIQAIGNDERRDAYRRPQTQAHRLSISVRTARGDEHVGAFQDLSIGGASARFAINERVLCPGQTVVVTIGSLTRLEKVVAKARVMFSMESQGGRYCGFKFTEPAVLAKQIDGFYARFFNRRKSPRVGVPLDRKVNVFLFATGSEIKTELIDLSSDGMQVRGPRAAIKGLDGLNHAFVRFKLPSRTEEITGRVAILRRTQTREMVTLGLAFDLVQDDGIGKHQPTINSWIVHRTNEIMKWDGSLAKQPLPEHKDGGPQKPTLPGWSSDSASARRLG